MCVLLILLLNKMNVSIITPLSIGISDDQLFPNAIFILESSKDYHILLNNSMNNAGI